MRTIRKFWLPELEDAQLASICRRALSNDSVEQVILGPIRADKLAVGGNYQFQLQTVPIRELNDEQLQQLSKIRPALSDAG